MKYKNIIINLKDEFYERRLERVERIELSSKGWKPLIIAIIRHPHWIEL
jgi:hypothetical protein